MPELLRVVFQPHEGVARLIILCPGCLQDVRQKTTNSNMSCVVRDFGTGSGECEFCQHEIASAVGAL